MRLFALRFPAKLKMFQTDFPIFLPNSFADFRKSLSNGLVSSSLLFSFFLGLNSQYAGGKVMGLSTGLFPDKAEVADLGRCKKVVITSKKTTFIGSKGDVSAKIETIKNLRDSSEINKEAYNERIARLKGEVAVIKVGAASGVDLGYLKDKIEDAVYSTKGAYQEGAVRGGGIALKEIAENLPNGILKKALQSPYNQIQENAGRRRTWWGGYKGGLVIKDNVWDSVKSTRIVVENACSFAGSILTTMGSIATVRIKADK